MAMVFTLRVDTIAEVLAGMCTLGDFAVLFSITSAMCEKMKLWRATACPAAFNDGSREVDVKDDLHPMKKKRRKGVLWKGWIHKAQPWTRDDIERISRPMDGCAITLHARSQLALMEKTVVKLLDLLIGREEVKFHSSVLRLLAFSFLRISPFGAVHPILSDPFNGRTDSLFLVPRDLCLPTHQMLLFAIGKKLSCPLIRWLIPFASAMDRRYVGRLFYVPLIARIPTLCQRRRISRRDWESDKPKVLKCRADALHGKTNRIEEDHFLSYLKATNAFVEFPKRVAVFLATPEVPWHLVLARGNHPDYLWEYMLLKAQEMSGGRVSYEKMSPEEQAKWIDKATPSRRTAVGQAMMAMCLLDRSLAGTKHVPT